MKDYSTQITALIIASMSSIGFAFKFLYDSRDYPELAAVLLGVLAVSIGLFAFISAWPLCVAFVFILGNYEKQKPPRNLFGKCVTWIARIGVVFGMLFFLYFGFWGFLNGAEFFGEQFIDLRELILEQKMINLQERADS